MLAYLRNFVGFSYFIAKRVRLGFAALVAESWVCRCSFAIVFSLIRIKILYIGIFFRPRAVLMLKLRFTLLFSLGIHGFELSEYSMLFCWVTSLSSHFIALVVYLCCKQCLGFLWYLALCRAYISYLGCLPPCRVSGVGFFDVLDCSLSISVQNTSLVSIAGLRRLWEARYLVFASGGVILPSVAEWLSLFPCYRYS